MKNELEQRLVRLEAHLAHIERQNDAINEIVVEQGKLLQKLQAHVRRLSESAEATELDRIKSTNPRPPHYQ